MPPRKSDRVRDLLHEAGETHHRVYRITDGVDDDWASHSELPDELGVRPVPSELVYMLVRLDKEFTARNPGVPWEDYYASELLRHFTAGG